VKGSSGLRRPSVTGAYERHGLFSKPCKAGGTAEDSVFRPVTGGDFLFSKTQWRKLCTTRYRRI
jgi:hypothetical protein